MAMKTTVTSRGSKRPAAVKPPLLFHRINTLLHTMRCIAQYEDELCTLLHAAQNSKIVAADLGEDLRALLETMPSCEYSDDLESLRAALPADSANPSTTREARKPRIAKQVRIAKKPRVAKKARIVRKTAMKKKAMKKNASSTSKPKTERRAKGRK